MLLLIRKRYTKMVLAITDIAAMANYLFYTTMDIVVYSYA